MNIVMNDKQEKIVDDLASHLDLTPESVHNAMGFTRASAFRSGVTQGLVFGQEELTECRVLLSRLRAHWLGTELEDRIRKAIGDTL